MMRTVPRSLLIALALAGAPFALQAAEPMNAQSQEEVSPAVAMPKQGLSMTQVEKQFGTPKKKIPAVGKPPITRWVYDGYIVYFEYQYVIHSVATVNGSE